MSDFDQSYMHFSIQMEILGAALAAVFIVGAFLVGIVNMVHAERENKRRYEALLREFDSTMDEPND